MAERKLSGKDLFLFRGNGETSSETFDVFACSESSSIKQSNSEISAETNCGVLKLPGSSDSSVDFSIIPVLNPDADKVPILTLQTDFDDKSFHNFKITTASPVAGDPIWSFRGFIKDLNYDMSATAPLKGSGTIQVDDAGVTLTLAT